MNDKREKTVSGSESNISIVNCQLSIVNCQFSRSAFTLVELLTVVVIISMLAALSTVALTESMQTAREIKTRGTIQKLDTAIQGIFESYGDRFDGIINEVTPTPPALMSDANKQHLKLHLIRDLMRMEMPQSWAEVYDSGSGNMLGPISVSINSTNYSLSNSSPVLSFYYREYQRLVANGGNVQTASARAALLFLIIANLNPEALEGFGGNELKDTDGDGLMEFVDAWGKPILFLRWAPAFPDTDRQPDIFALSGNVTPSLSDDPGTPTASPWMQGPNETNSTSSLANGFSKASARWADPFDDSASGSVQNGWFLYPLIYSAGRDGVFGIYSETSNQGSLVSPSVFTTAQQGPGTLDAFQHPYGYPIDGGNGKFQHYDNIHNHRHSGGF